MARRFRSGMQYRRAKGQFRKFALLSGAKRILRDNTNFSMTTGANVETIQTLMTAADAPGDIKSPEAGSKLTVINIRGEASTPTTGGLYEILIYLDRSGLTIPSTTPIADFWATTEPPTRNSLDIRRMTLRYIRKNVATGNSAGLLFGAKIRFKRGLAMYDGDRIRMVIRCNVSTTAAITYEWTAVTRK